MRLGLRKSLFSVCRIWTQRTNCRFGRTVVGRNVAYPLVLYVTLGKEAADWSSMLITGSWVKATGISCTPHTPTVRDVTSGTAATYPSKSQTTAEILQVARTTAKHCPIPSDGKSQLHLPLPRRTAGRSGGLRAQSHHGVEIQTSGPSLSKTHHSEDQWVISAVSETVFTRKEQDDLIGH